MAKKSRWKGSDRADTHGRALIATDRWLDGREISEEELPGEMLKHLIGSHKDLAEMVYYVEGPEKPRGVGHPPGQTFDGKLTQDATDYAQLLKRQMKGNTYSVDLKAAQKAARAFIDNDPFFADYDYKDLWTIIRTNLRNNR
jgi:hypothetical protein